MVISNLLRRRTFALADFQLAPLEFEEERLAELAELLLDDPISQASVASNVVGIRTAAGSCPAEMRERIERHLEAKDAAHPLVDPLTPGQELQQALADLRRSIG